MQDVKIILLALAIAFCWVEYINPFKVKPFKCTKCMTGWFAFLIGCMVYGYTKHYLIIGKLNIWFPCIRALVMLPVGVFVGAMFEAIKMRWL